MHQKPLDHTKKSATDALKTSSEKTGDFIGNKIANRITKVSKIHKKLLMNY